MNMKVMIAQTNSTVGDLFGNLSIIQQSILQAVSAACDVIVFPELATIGYPPRDLLYSSVFWENHKRVIDKLDAFVRGQSRQITVIVGGLHEVMLSGGRYARYNAAWILDKHFGRRVVHKRLLPCYDVFDETRYFSSAIDEPCLPIPIHLAGIDVPDELCNVLICEDIWNNEYCGGQEYMKPATYTIDPIDAVARHGKGPLFVLNGSPFWLGKIEETQKLVESICDRLQRPVVWCNQVGSHDDIITGGYSMVAVPGGAGQYPKQSPMIGNDGRIVTVRRARAFQEDHIIVHFDDTQTNYHNLKDDIVDRLICLPSLPLVVDADFEMWTIYKALFLHMSDYKRRCGFERAVLGLSGGIDSAVVAVIAAHVFGSENVTGVAMPSPHSSEGSVSDAEVLATNLKIRFEVKEITETYEAVQKLFLSGGKQQFGNPIADENIQPRARGMILMAYSNEHDPCLLLTTGNKSEITVGYCTIYGDMCGGLAVISDIWKTQVYQMAQFLNKYFDEPIPEDTITKPPSAELRPDQQDTDSLPPYDVLDPLLRLFVEQEMTAEQVIAEGQWVEVHRAWFKETGQVHRAWFKETGQVHSEVAREMYRKYRDAEYKRQQMAVGPKLSVRGYGSGRRMPIAMKLTTV